MATVTDIGGTPGNGDFDHKLLNEQQNTACVYCGEFDADFRDHFMKHYAVNGGEYGRYSAAYSMGHDYAHERRTGDWAVAEQELRVRWERRGQGGWDDFKGAVQYGWKRVQK